jgi:hypothetical protein
MQIKLLKALGGFLVGSAFLWVCIVCFLRHRIGLAIGLIKESAKALGQMPVLTAFPFIQTFGLVAFMVVWIVVCLYLVSAGPCTISLFT